MELWEGFLEEAELSLEQTGKGRVAQTEEVSKGQGAGNSL